MLRKCFNSLLIFIYDDILYIGKIFFLRVISISLSRYKKYDERIVLKEI